MIASVARAYRPRVGLDAAAPLFQRWQRMQQRVLAEIPEGNPLRGTANLMCDERSIDQMEDAIAEARHQQATAALPPDVDSPQRRALADELREMQTQYGTLVFEIRNTQTKWLPSAARNWRHKLAGTIAADCFNAPPPISKFTDRWDAWTPTQDLKKLIEDWRPWLTWTRQVAAQLNAARAFDSLTAGDQALELVKALANQQTAITDRCERIEAALSAINVRLDPPRRKKQRTRMTSNKQTHEVRP